MFTSDIGLYTNRNQRGDFVRNAILRSAAGGRNVYAAVAFFTEADVVQELLAKGCRVRLIVRLGFPTSPGALERILGEAGLQVRFFTSQAFHPKLYIFGNETALVGSANLTRKAILTNNEVVVSLDSIDPRFVELVSLFSEYWEESRVLDPATLETYRSIYRRFEAQQAALDKAGSEIIARLGDTSPSNIDRSTPKSSKQSIFLEDFRRSYQECVSAFNVVRSAYQDSGYRKAEPAKIPLRLEIDSFISFVRERKAIGDSWTEAPLRTIEEQRPIIRDLIDEWSATSWPHFEKTIVLDRYPRLSSVFESASSIAEASDDDLFEALCTLHSFFDRRRFHSDGLPNWKKAFQAANEPKRVRETLAYLVHGSDNIESRMANAIYDHKFKLNEFGQSNVQELIGWCNREDLPVINGRTTKVLRFFGSDVSQIG